MSAPIPPSQLVAALHWRYATKKFDPTRKIPGETWHALEQALVLTPSSIGLQPWKFFVITDAEVKNKLFTIGIEAVGNSPADLAQIMKIEIAKWGKVIREAGIQPQ